MANRYQTLDGWRGVSILLVLLGHLFPLGSKEWDINGAVAASGMVLFFILSGFLITSILQKDMNIKNFIIRRFLRIIPLAWVYMLVILGLHQGNQELYLPHLLFYANWEPIALQKYGTAHIWSLCVEMQFYVGIAVLVFIFRSKALLLLPLLCIADTVYRYSQGITMAINTYYRIDEILAGCLLALIHSHGGAIKRFIGRLNPILLFPILVLSAHPASAELNYMRPYIAMLIVGSTLFKENQNWSSRWLENKTLVYIASISYAIYILHEGFVHSWLGEGDVIEKYAKRPLLLICTFALAHLSTNYYEKYWIQLGKRLTSNKSPSKNGVVG